MPQPSMLFLRARSLGRALAASLLAAAVATCDSPTSMGRPGTVALAPSFASSLSQVQFAGLVVDQARVTIVRPPSDTVARRSFPFAPGDTALSARVEVSVQGTGEDFTAIIELLAGTMVVFTGTQQVYVVPGPPATGTPPVQIQVAYVGPGSQVAALAVDPPSAALLFGGTQQFTVTAADSQQQAVASFYAGWRTSDPAHVVDAQGRLTAGTVRGAFWVIAQTPTGIRDSARVMVSPVANAIGAYSGDGQVGTIGLALAQPLVARVTAADGGPVAGVDVAFSMQTGGGAVGAATVVTDTLGLAATTVTLGSLVGAQTFRASAGGAGQVTFTVTATPGAGVPASIQKVAGDGQSAVAGTTLPVLPRVRVVDAFGTYVAGVQVQFAVTGGGGSAGSPTVTTDTGGYAETDWVLGATAGGNTMTASLPAFGGVAPVVFTAVGTPLLPPILLNLPVGSVPVGGTALLGVKLGQPAPAGGVVVTVTSDSAQYATVASPGTVTIAAGDSTGSIDINGGQNPGVTVLRASATGYAAAQLPVAVTPNILTVSAASVTVGQSTTVTITAIPGPAADLPVTVTSTDSTIAAVLTPNVTIPGGQTTTTATVQGVAFGAAGILVSAPAYAQGGNVVTVYGVAASLVLVSGGNQNAAPSTTLPQPVVVLVTDALGNPVPGFAVAFAVASGGGSVGTPATTTDASGLASTTWTLGAAAGTQTLTVTAAGLSGSPLTVSANAPVIATTTVTPQLDTITAINGTTTLVAQAKDATGANLTGAFTWTSLTPAVATVGPTGVVRAVTNGTTLIVATETGGTADTATVVVDQQIGSIAVTPSVRSLYLAGTFQFAAVAVDGLGTPLPTQPSFTWSTTAPAVATVDSTGLVTAAGIGSAQIRATSGTVIGVANIGVITPITRIAVAVDSAGATSTDTATLASLGITRRYRAIAFDTLDAVMSGVSFTWVSTNGSVALMNSTAGDTASITSAANGVTSIRASAVGHGVTSSPGALLTVQQVLASIELTPPVSNPTATIGIGGTVTVVARGKDANGRYIPGGTFAYTSSNAAIATVDGATGRVTGVAIGVDTITATSAAITSNPLPVTVGGAVPKAISFGRDTVSVGRGSTAQIPILLSTPDTAALSVTLAAPAFAHWNPAQVTIPAGQTSVNANLVGDSAGTTTVTAVDSSGRYTGGSAIAKVTANMRLTNAGYSILATDIVQTQVLLSDPSPAGGTYVTFTYGTPGIAATSPDPAFIPAGQLAADIQIRGLAAGTTTITPSAIGVNGAASNLNIYPPLLYPSTTFIRLGQGQYDQNHYVYTQVGTNVPIPVALVSSDTNIIRPSPSAVTIPGGSNVAYFNVAAPQIGAATITPVSPGWTAQNTISVVATTPYVGLCCSNGSLLTTSPQFGLTVYAQDSTRNAHYRTNSLVVNLRSSDPTVIQLLDTVTTVAPGQYYTSAPRAIPGGLGGTAWVVATASGHGSDSVQYTVTGPSLYFSWGTNRIGAGQEDRNLYVYAQNAVTAPLVVNLVNPDSNIVGVPDSVTIPTGSNIAYFNVLAKTPGSVTLTATAAGYQSVNATYVVTTPRLVISGGGTINNFAPPRGYTVYSTDSTGNAHYRTTPLALTLSSDDTLVVRTDTVATIGAGQYYVQPQVTPVDTGSTRIHAAAAGHSPDSTTYTIVTPKLNLSWNTYTIGRRQNRAANDFYVYTPDTRSVTLPVILTQTNAAAESLTTLAPDIPAGSNIRYFTFYGLANGVDTVIASATGYNPDTAFVIVTTPRLTASGLPGGRTTTSPPFGVTVYAADSLGNAHYASDTVVVAAVSSDSAVIQPVQPYFAIPKGAYFASQTVTITGPGGPASITYSDSAGSGYGPVTTNTMTVTGPSLTLGNGSPMLGMRQRGGTNSSYVYAPNPVATPLTVNLLSTDTRVATVPASVTIPVGGTTAYFEVTALDTLGTIQVQATATGYGGAAMSVQVTLPRFVVSTAGTRNTTSAPTGITVYAADANGNPHYTTEDVAVTLQSSAPSVALVDSSTVTIVSGNYLNSNARWAPGVFGTSQIEARDDRAALYAYGTGTQNVSVVTPNLNFSWGTEVLGIGQYIDEYVYSADAAASDITVPLNHTGAARISTLVSGSPVGQVTIPQGTNISYFRIVGTSAGTDTLVASATAPAHNPATAYTTVGQGRTDPIGGWPATLANLDSVLVTMYARDPNGNGRYVLAATDFTPTLTNLEFWSGGPNSVQLTTVTVPAGAYYVQFYVKATAQGTGGGTIAATNYQTQTLPAVTIQ